MKYKKFKFSCQISTLHSKHVFHVTRVSRETVSIRDNYTSSMTEDSEIFSISTLNTIEHGPLTLKIKPHLDPLMNLSL